MTGGVIIPKTRENSQHLSHHSKRILTHIIKRIGTRRGNQSLFVTQEYTRIVSLAMQTLTNHRTPRERCHKIPIAWLQGQQPPAAI